MSEQEEIQKERATHEESALEEAGADTETLIEAAGESHSNGRTADGGTADGSTAERDTDEDEVEQVPADEVTLEDPQAIITRLEADLAEASTKAEHYLDQMQRAAAEFQNVRKRQERQLELSIERATEGIVRRLLPVLDDFELALGNIPDSLEGEEQAWVDGFARIQQKLVALVQEEGVQTIEPSGEFDPNCHEAVTHEPSDEVESGHIIETLRTGYEYKDRVLRPALVRVAQ